MFKDVAGVERGSYALNPEMAQLAGGLARVGGNIVDDSQKAAQALFATRVRVDGETAEAASGADLSKPLLSPPRAPLVKGMNSAAMLIQLLGELMALMGEAGKNELEGRIALFRGMADARQKSLEKVSQELTEAVDTAEESVVLYETAQGLSKAAKTAASGAMDEAKAAEEELKALETDDPGRPQVLLRNQAAQSALQSATQKLSGAAENEKRLSADMLQKIKVATDAETRSNAAASAAPAKDDVAQYGSSVARLSLLMASLSKLIGEGSNASMKNDQEIFQEIQTQRQKALEKSAADYEAEVQKAEQINKTMGCIGKIVGAILTVVSIVAIPFSGGASAALAVIGVGLMAADAITSAATGGKSLTDMAMAPLLTHIIQPIIEALGKAIATALEIAGVPAEKAQLIGNVLAAVVTAIVMIVIMVAAAVAAKSSAASKLIEKFAQPLVKTMTKMSTAMVRDFGAATVKQVDAVANAAGTVLNGLASTVQAGGSIAEGIFIKKAKNHEAEMVISSHVLDQIGRYIKDAIEKFSATAQAKNQLNTLATATNEQTAQTARFILRRARG